MGHPRRVTPRPHADLVAHLVRSTPLNEGEADRVVAEVFDWFAEPVPDFVRRRHRELAARGLTNDRIFASDRGGAAGAAVPRAAALVAAAAPPRLRLTRLDTERTTMCGIVGYIGAQDAAPILLEGLGRLEYRGYDSAGVAVVTRSGLKIRKSQGRVADLAAGLPARFKGAPGHRAHALGHPR